MVRSVILASRSPQRRRLLQEAGWDFRVSPPADSAESGRCSGESPAAFVQRLAVQKAANVAERVDSGVVLACDTVAEVGGEILGKPADREHARAMLQLLSGKEHRVLSGLCLWIRPRDRQHVGLAVTRLRMAELSPNDLESYLDTELWEGKAGAFGYQDGWDWLEIVEGSESNVIGLPLELLDRMWDELHGENGGGSH